MYTAPTKDETVHALKNASQNLRDNVSETAKETSRDLREVANDAGRKVRSFIDSASEEFSHASDTVTTQIRNKPVQSSLVALGVGFILGALFRR